MGAMSPRVLLIVALVCAVFGLLVLPAVSPETGSTANALFFVQVLVLLAGVAALVLLIIRRRAAKRVA